MTLRTLAALSIALLLTGCSLTSTGTPSATPGASLHGSVHGGQQPIAGASVYLFAADANAYGNPSDSLLDPTITGLSDIHGDGYVLTDANGNFSISGAYTCTAGQQVYLYTIGGDPGAGVNSAASLMAVLGNCPGGNFAATVPFISIDEVSTIAAAYAFAGYAVDATDVSSSGTQLALTGIANAFANAANLADLPSGTALATTPAGNGIVPQATINTLANILAACINSTGPGSPPCSALFTNTVSLLGVSPTDTATAVINIAHNPAANVAALFFLPAATPPFGSALTTQPNDFTLALTFSGGGIAATQNLAIDAQGNIWATDNSGYVAELNSLGVPVSPSTGFTSSSLSSTQPPVGIAVDATGDVWVTTGTAGLVPAVEFSADGSTSTPITSLTTLDAVNSISFDQTGNVLLPAATLKSVYRFDSNGNPLATFTTPHHMDGLTTDASGHLWTTNNNHDALTEIFTGGSTPGQVISSTLASGNTDPGQVAVGANGSIWSLASNGMLGVLNSDGSMDFSAPTLANAPAGSVALASNFAIDGAGSAWVVTNITTQDEGANSEPGAYSLALVSSTGTLLSGAGYGSFTPQQLSNIQIDGSGNVWLSTSTTLTELIGAAAPVVTPIAAAVANGANGMLP